MTTVWALLLLTAVIGFLVFYLVKWGQDRGTFSELFCQLKNSLPLKEAVIRKYPVPTLTGRYFGYLLSIEGSSQKRKTDRQPGYRFLVTVDLPRSIQMRLFLLHERRKTSLKPIARLCLVPTEVGSFNDRFLLLSDHVDKARGVFQPYLCQKILSLLGMDWQLDVQGGEAYLEVWKETLDASLLSEWLKVMVECLNDLSVKEG